MIKFYENFPVDGPFMSDINYYNFEISLNNIDWMSYCIKHLDKCQFAKLQSLVINRGWFYRLRKV